MEKFEKKVWLSSPTMHGDELKFITEAYQTNWMSTVGKNIDEIEKLIEQRTQARKDKNWAEADRIRDQLKDMGIVLEDTPQGIKWKKI